METRVNTKETGIKAFPVIPVVALAVILSFFGPMWQLFISSFPYWTVSSLGDSVCSIGLTLAPFLVMLLAAPLQRIRIFRDKINATNLAYAYMVSLVASYFITYPSALGLRYVFASRYTEEALADRILPWFMAPPASVCRVISTGGAIDWGAWAVPIAWWWAVNLGQCIFFLALATIMRKQWTDVEQVPFPQTVLVRELAQNILATTGESASKRRWFLIGLLIGLVFQIPITLTGIFPWFPDIYGVKVNTCADLIRYFPSGDMAAAIPGIMSVNYNPAVLAVAYQAPMAVLFSTWFFALFYMIAVQIAYAMGYYTGIESVGTCGRYWCHPSPGTDPPLKFMPIAAGGLLALGVMNLALNRRYIAKTLRAAMGGKDQDEERDEAMSYRTAYLLLLGSFVLIIAFWMASSLSFLDALLLPIGAFLIWYGMTRIYGLSGAYWQSGDKGFTLLRIVHPVADSPVTTQQYLLYKWGTSPGGDTPDAGWGAAAFSSFAGYKMGKLSGVHPRNAFRAILIAMIISPLFSLLGFLTLLHGVGGSRIGMWKNWFEGIGERFENIPTSWTTTPAVDPWIPHMLLGIVLISVLSYLHARFVWFPFEPIGWLIGTSAASSLFGLWAPFLVAWVLKMITFRVGGAKLFENKGLPIASGAVTGCVIGLLICGLLFIIRFFIPF